MQRYINIPEHMITFHWIVYRKFNMVAWDLLPTHDIIQNKDINII